MSSQHSGLPPHPSDGAHGDVPHHWFLHARKDMEEVEERCGQNPDALMPRFLRRWHTFWGRLLGL